MNTANTAKLSTATQINETVKLSNQSGVDVVVLDAHAASGTSEQGYLQDLKFLSMASGNVLKNGASTTATLHDTYVNSQHQTAVSHLYNLLVSRTDSLFPVMTVGEQLDFNTETYPDINITAAAAKNMQTALTFCQNIMTSPSSQMSANFQSAMKDAFSSGSVADGNAKMAAFFNQYPTFAGLDFPSYVAVSTWMRGFAYLWGMNDQGKPGATFYVYSAATGQNAKGATSEGTITFTRKPNAPSPADPSDRQSAYTITLTSQGSSKTLQFSNGQLIDSSGGAITLNCTFGYKGTFTGKDSDTTALTLLAGTMLGKSVIAIPLAPESGWDKFWSNLTFGTVFKYFMEAMGLWMALDFLKQKLTAKNDKLAEDKANENDGKDPTSEQVQEAQNDGQQVGDQARADNQAQLDNASGDVQAEVPSEADFSSSVSEVRASGSSAYKSVASDNTGGAIESAAEQVSDLAEIENTDQLQEANDDLLEAKGQLDAGDISSANANVTTVNEQLPQIVEDMGSAVSEELAEQVKEAVEVQAEATELSEEVNDTAEETEGGTEEPFEDGVFPEA